MCIPAEIKGRFAVSRYTLEEFKKVKQVSIWFESGAWQILSIILRKFKLAPPNYTCCAPGKHLV